jgi:uncharacterized protein YdeI (YjbR/CyaY-like superfamily)
MNPIFFKTQDEFRDWLDKNHRSETELWVGYYKTATGKQCMSYSESVDQALCFGWIDGIRKSVDAESYCNRFTPRKSRSKWSAVNIAKVKELTRLGLMAPAGFEAYSYCNESNSKVYSFENPEKTMPAEFEAIFVKNPAAWEFFQKQPPSYKKMAVHWILDAKQESTRFARLTKIIEASESHGRLFDQYRSK